MLDVWRPFQLFSEAFDSGFDFGSCSEPGLCFEEGDQYG